MKGSDYMTLPRGFRVFLLSILCFFINLPIGIDLPGWCEITSCSLNDGTVVCDTLPEGYTFDFTIQCRQGRRAAIFDGSRSYLDLKVFDSDESKAKYPDDVINYQFDETDLENGYDPKDYYHEHILYEDVFPALDVTVTYEIVGDPILIRSGDEYTYSVHVVLPSRTPAGTYSVVYKVDYNFNEFIYQNVLVIP